MENDKHAISKANKEIINKYIHHAKNTDVDIYTYRQMLKLHTIFEYEDTHMK